MVVGLMNNRRGDGDQKLMLYDLYVRIMVRNIGRSPRKATKGIVDENRNKRETCTREVQEMVICCRLSNVSI